MLMIEMAAVSGKSISCLLDEMTAKFGKYYMQEKEFRFRQDQVEAVKRQLADITELKALPDYKQQVKKIRTDDGLKITFVDDSFVLLRFSGTEPVLRVFAESQAASETEALIKSACGLLRSEGLQI